MRGGIEKLKEAILRRYDISEDTYRQRFRETSKKEGESVGELAVRLTDLLQKWTKGCRTVDEIRDMLVKEQLLIHYPQMFGSMSLRESQRCLQMQQSLRTVIYV